MLRRHVQALAAGVSVAIVLQESAWTGFDWVDPSRSLNSALLAGPATPGLMTPLLLAWLLGGFAGGLMGALVGGHRVHGIAVGVVLAASAWTLLRLAWPGAGAIAVVGAVPIPAAVVAAALAERVLRERRPNGTATASDGPEQ